MMNVFVALVDNADRATWHRRRVGEEFVPRFDQTREAFRRYAESQ